MTPDRPAAPSPEDVEAFVKWMVKYGNDFAGLRIAYGNNLDRFVELSWKDVSQEIAKRDLSSADALMMRGGELAQWYNHNVEKLVEARGGINQCPTNLRITAIAILVKTFVMLRLA